MADPVRVLARSRCRDECRVSGQPELLAEVLVPSRLTARELIAAPPRLASRLDRVEDSSVAGAAAKCPSSAFATAARSPFLPCSISDAARTTIPGMQKPHWTPPSRTNASPILLRTSLRQPFESHDVATLCLLGLAQTGERGRAVDRDEAAAARAFGRAPVFRGDDAALFPQHLEEVHARLVARRPSLSRSE